MHFFVYDLLEIGFLLVLVTHVMGLVNAFLQAGIHGFVPTGFFQSHIGGNNPLAVPVSVILAVPMYANAAGVIPVLEALVARGIPLGTALAFMMAVVGLSLPEAMMLRKAMKPRLLGVFFGSESR